MPEVQLPGDFGVSTNLWDNRHAEKHLWDVELVLDDGQRILASKLDLCKFSGYFGKMFRGEFVERGQSEVRIQDVRGAILEAIVQAHYTGKVRHSLQAELCRGWGSVAEQCWWTKCTFPNATYDHTAWSYTTKER
jgi:hypothetical protein